MDNLFLNWPLAFLNRLRIPAKFALIALVFFLAALVPTFTLVRAQDRDMAALNLEQEGTAFLAPLYALAAHVAQHRMEYENAKAGAGAAYDNGPSLANLATSIEADLAQVGSAQPAFKAEERARTLKESWSAVLSAEDPARHLKAVDALLGSILVINSEVVDSSGLIVDPDLATFYIIDLSTVILPQQAVQTLGLMSRAQAAAAKQEPAGEEQERLQIQVGAVQTLVTQIRKETDGTRGFSRPEAALRLGPMLKTHLATSDAFLNLVSTALQGSQPGISPSAVRYSGRQAVLNGFRFQEAAQRVLASLLEQRARANRWQQRWTLGGSLAAEALAFLLLAALYRGFKQGLGTVVESLDAVLAGDLTRQAVVNSQDEFGTLAQHLNDSMESLRNMVVGIQQVVQGMLSTSSNLATGSGDLAQRTEAQAASLEQTAASTEEISVLAGQTGHRASLANQDAQRMDELLRACQEAVLNAAEAIAEINASSARVAKVTAVVEEIAFHANLLSVDAVIAAASGERERAFSMLATEVHGLGKRSAEASEQIKLLLQESAGLVLAGNGHIVRASGAVQDLARELAEVVAFIKEVSTSAGEQALGITQISEAMAHLEGLTQHNAGLVEVASVAAGNLASEARELARLVAHFQTGQFCRLQEKH